MKFRHYTIQTIIMVLLMALMLIATLTGCDPFDSNNSLTSYTVNFESNGGSEVENQTVLEGLQASSPINPVKPGFEFDNWYIDSELQTVYDFNRPVIENITLYAKWLILYTVTFNSNGGSEVQSQNVAEGRTVNRPHNPDKTGFGFAGWFSDESLVIEYDFEIPVNDNIMLYASWDTNFFTVSFNSLGGSAVASQNIAYNGTATRPDDPVRNNYTFEGWYSDTNLTIEYLFDSPVTAEFVLYAKWSINQYTVTFIANGGNPAPDPTVVTHGETIAEPPAMTRNFHIFGGWFKEDGFVNLWNFAADTVTVDTTLYARWSINQFTVTFNANGGHPAPDPQIVNYDGTVDEPIAMTRQYYTFGGWYKEVACINEWDFSDDKVSGNITLYAKWIVNTITNINYIIEYLGQIENPYDTVILPLQIDLGNMPQTGSGWWHLLNAIEEANRYVYLDLSLCTMVGTEFNPAPAFGTRAKPLIVSLVLPDAATSIAGVTTLPSNPIFSRFTTLETFSGKNITSIGDMAFAGCEYLAITELPAGLVSIGAGAFAGCSRLALTELPLGLSSIGFAAFENCINLKSLSLPASVNFPGSLFTAEGSSYFFQGHPFIGCTSLASFSLTGAGPLSTIDNGKALVLNGTELLAYPGASGSITLPAGLTSIGNHAFADANLSQITLPVGITSIGSWAFYRNRNLIQVTLPAGITTIDDLAFSICDKLEQINLPEELIFIGGGAFGSCTNLALTELPAGLTHIGNSAFDYCTNLALTELPAGLTHIGDYVFRGCTNLALTELPAGLTHIGDNAFRGCTSLALTELPAGLTHIGDYAFSGCTSLEQLTLPAGITSVGEQTFMNCTNLRQITLPTGLIFINHNAFNGCTSLEQITLPAGLSEIGRDAFMNCTSLKLVTSLRTTPPNLIPSALGIRLFNNTHPDLSIKVPAASVTAYRNHLRWGQYASIISAIE